MRLDTKLETVREQYEALPYPPRNPQDELTRLQMTSLDIVEQIDHYCFRGEFSSWNDCAVLVAGGGTGDATILLAEQLRDCNARIVHVDISEQSMEIARARAKVRSLDNIEWLHARIEDLRESNIGHFDYINCSGVLHHLEDPLAGLTVLSSLLTERGAMGLMLYGRYGRAGIYEVQEILRRLTPGMDIANKLRTAKRVIASLPEGNPLVKNKAHWAADLNTDAGVYDLLLHSIDRAYTIPEVYEMLDATELNLVEFVGTGVESPRGYRPETYVNDLVVMTQLLGMDNPQAHAMAELLCGEQRRHTFYASRQIDTIAPIDSLNVVPVLHPKFRIENLGIAEALGRGENVAFGDEYSKIVVEPTPFHHLFFKNLDGQRSLNDMLRKMKKSAFSELNGLSADAFLDNFRKLYSSFSSLAWMFVRRPKRRHATRPEAADVLQAG